MPIYQQVGGIPRKRHIQFRSRSGVLYHEELVGTHGFSGVSALVYHLHPPTIVKHRDEPYSIAPRIAIAENLQALSFGKGNFQALFESIEDKQRGRGAL